MNEQKETVVNVEKIMSDIRQRIKMEEEMNALPTFESIPFRNEVKTEAAAVTSSAHVNWAEYLESLDYANRNYDIPYYWSFGPNSSIKVFLKRVVRKLAKCIIPPIMARQNEMNARYVRCLNQLRWFVEETSAQNRELNAELARLKEHSAEQERRFCRMEEELRTIVSKAQTEQKNALDAALHKQDAAIETAAC